MKRVKKYTGEIITFILTTLLLLIIFKSNDLFNKSIIISDLRTQLYPLITNLKESLSSNTFSLYDLRYGMGDSIIGTIYYYLMSVTNILALFIKNLNIFFITIIIIKSALAGSFCYIYLKYQFKKENKLYFVLFSLLYSLSSYYISYNMVTEFLDVYMLFPILLLGIDKMIKEKKYLLYIISLILIIASNYYFSYMVCIFAFLYFNYRLVIERKKIDYKLIIKENKNFIIISFLTCLIMSFVYLPIALEIGSYSHDSSSLFGGQPLKILFNLEDIIHYYFIGDFKDVNVINCVCFYLYTSIIILPLLYLYFINNKIVKKEKLATTIMLLIMLMSIGINYINYIWHGFIPPTGFNGRFTFMFILFLILISLKSLYNLKEFKDKDYIIIFSIIYVPIFIYSIINYPRLISIETLISLYVVYFFTIILSLLITQKINKITSYIIALSILLITYILINRVSIIVYLYNLCLVLICSFILSFINKKHELKLSNYILVALILLIPISIYSIIVNIRLLHYITLYKLILLTIIIMIIKYLPKNKKLIYLFSILVIIELTINGYNYLNRFKYKEIDNSYSQVIEYIKSIDKSNFYRIEDNLIIDAENNSLLYNYYGIDYFMSTSKKDYINFFKRLNVNDKTTASNTITYDGSNHLVSSLLGIKYYIETNYKNNSTYKEINRIKDYKIYLNEDSLELGYMVDKKIINNIKDKNGLDYINSIYKNMTNNDKNILEEVNVKKKNKNNYYFTNTSKKDIYLLVELNDKKGPKPSHIYVNGEIITTEQDNNTYQYRINNKYQINDNIEIKIKGKKKALNKVVNVYAYYYNDEVYKEDINILKEQQFKVTSIKYNTIKGVIDSKEDNILLITSLYNDDLKIYVDGKKQDKIKVLDAFLGTNITKGKHKIKIVYKPTKLYISFIPSLIGLVLLIIYLKRNKKM